MHLVGTSALADASELFGKSIILGREGKNWMSMICDSSSAPVLVMK